MHNLINAQFTIHNAQCTILRKRSAKAITQCTIHNYEHKNRSPYAVRTATQRYTTAILKWLISKYIESCSMIDFLDKRAEGRKGRLINAQMHDAQSRTEVPMQSGRQLNVILQQSSNG